ncbi:hypothetical protein [Marmoricola sp. RAF53]|uniref:hypothetical protein n=1 Tax=Marmoricola sp. RAF53 TaxID=3233059 RepID=UPI003F9E2456
MWIKGAIRLAGAAVIGVGCVVLLVQPGVSSMSSELRPGPPESSFVTAAVEDRFDLADFQVSTRAVDPEGDGPVRVFFDVSYGDRVSADAPSSPSADSGASSGTSGAQGFSIVLSGRISRALLGCDDPSVEVAPVRFAALTRTEKRAVVGYLSGQGNPADQRDQTPGAQVSDLPWDVAFGLGYTRLSTATVYTDDSPGEITKDDEEVLFKDHFHYFTCSFDKDAFWSEDGLEHLFEFPGAAGASTARRSRSSAIKVRTRVEAPTSPVNTLYAVQGPNGQNDQLVTSFVSSKTSWEADGTPTTSVSGMAARFRLPQEQQKHELYVFIAGIGASIIATLVLGSLKMFGAHGSARLFASRPAEPGDGP